MPSLKRRLKNSINFYRRRGERERFFSFVTCDEAYMVEEEKHGYRLRFSDGAQTTLPKQLFSFIKRWQSGDRPSLQIGKNTYLQNLKLDILLDQHVSIGSYCSFGPNVVIKPDGVRGKAQFTTYPLDLIDPNAAVLRKQTRQARGNFVTIGNDCFIGEDVKIMANVTIGDGVIIGERSLVTNNKTLEPYGIYAGMPARLIGYRYPPEIIEKLLEIRWWAWPLEMLRASGLQDIDFTTDPEQILHVLRRF